MNKKDVLELKRRFKKNECTFTKLCGCYVNAEKEIILNIEETFLNLEEEEFYKYLEIANKTLSGTIANNLLELEFPLDEEKPGGKQHSLLALRDSKLKNSDLLHSFYQLIIDTYDYAGNYLILVFHDAYDVMTKTSDNNKLDESEEVYEYLLCAICPVELSKPGLGYLQDENRIGPRNRDWVVSPPDSGFIFPSFTDRSTDLHTVMFYTKNVKEPHKELMEELLGCPAKSTATEQKNTFHYILDSAIPEEETKKKLIIDIQENLSQIVEEHAVLSPDSDEPVLLTTNSIQEILEETKLPEEISTKIESAFVETFSDTPPVVDHLLDTKLLAEYAKYKKEQELEEQVQVLQEKLEKTTRILEAEQPVADNYDVIVQVKPQKIDQISTQVIDGQKCVVIPMDENEQISVNGVDDLI